VITLLQLGSKLGRDFQPVPETSFSAIPVSGVHISELEDPTPYLEGGELLLTTGMPFAASPAASLDYASRLAAHGIRALGLGLGPWLAEVPSHVAQACLTFGIHLGVVPDGVPFQQVSRAYWQLTAHDATSDLMGSLGTQTALARAANRPNAESAVIRELAQALGGWAAYLDVDSEQDTYWPLSARDLLTQLRIECRRFHRVDMPSAATFEIQGQPVVVYPILSGNKLAGFLAVCARRQVTRADRQVMLTVATLLSLRARQRQAETTTQRVLRAAIARLLLHGEHHAARLIASDLGIEAQLDKQVRVMAVACRGQDNETILRRLTSLPLAPQLNHRRPDLSGDPLAFRDGNILYLVLGGDLDLPNPEVSADDETDGCRLSAVLSEPIGIAEIPGHLPALRHALSHAPEELLSAVTGSTETAAAGWVRILREHERTHLLPAVREYLRTRGTWEEASRTLGIHRNSLRLRVSTASRLLQVNIDDPDVAAQLWLAIRREES